MIFKYMCVFTIHAFKFCLLKVIYYKNEYDHEGSLILKALNKFVADDILNSFFFFLNFRENFFDIICELSVC